MMSFIFNMRKSCEDENIRYLQLYFAAHAPEVPDWFKKNWEDTSSNEDLTGMVVEWHYQFAKRLSLKFHEEACFRKRSDQSKSKDKPRTTAGEKF